MKYMSAGALFFNERAELLLVKPTYKEGWEIPRRYRRGGRVAHSRRAAVRSQRSSACR